MKRVIIYLITIIVSIFVGFCAFYMLIHYYPNMVVKTVNKVEKSVMITDTGISEGIQKIYKSLGKDVSKFEGHIACSTKSKSEIVVPIIKGNNVYMTKMDM